MIMGFDLKPCPFCGGKAVFETISNSSYHQGVRFGYTIKCSKCGCTPFKDNSEMSVFLAKDGDVIRTAESQVRQERLVKEWNNRPTEKGGAE